MREVAIVAGARTPFGRAGKGLLREVRPDTLAAHAVQAALKQVPGLAPAEIEDLVLGCALPEGEQGLNMARQVVFLAGLPVEVPALTINRFCSSGLQAMDMAAGRIAAGQVDVALAGGVESMSLVPMTSGRLSLHPQLADRFPEAYTPMGITAEKVAVRFGVSRADQDDFAVRSHARAAAAQQAGRFADEIAPIEYATVEDGQPVTRTMATDELVRADTTREKLAALKPAFDPTGTVTAGNSSPLTDGAAMTVLMAREVAEKRGLPILGILRHFTVVGVPPDIMGIGPVPAIRRLLAKTGLSTDQIDLFEVNEAFAAQAVYCQRELQLPDDKLNVNGGAIALGHPLGATGARQAITALHELRRRGGRYAVTSMCVGGGMGAAALLERV